MINNVLLYNYLSKIQCIRSSLIQLYYLKTILNNKTIKKKKKIIFQILIIPHELMTKQARRLVKNMREML